MAQNPSRAYRVLPHDPCTTVLETSLRYLVLGVSTCSLIRFAIVNQV